MKIKWRKIVGDLDDEFIHVGTYGNFKIVIGHYCTVISHKSGFPVDKPDKFNTVCVIEETSMQKDTKRDKDDADKKLREIIISLRDEMNRYAKDFEMKGHSDDG